MKIEWQYYFEDCGLNALKLYEHTFKCINGLKNHNKTTQPNKVS